MASYHLGRKRTEPDALRSKNQKRSELIFRSRYSDRVLRSQQKCLVAENRSKLEKLIEKSKQGQCRVAMNDRLLGTLAVWDQLIADTVGANGEDCTTALLKFDEAMDIFYSYFSNVNRPYLNTDRDKLQYALLHEEWGLCVCIVTLEGMNEKLIILRPDSFEIERFFDYVAQSKLTQKCKPRISLDKLLLQRILSTLDSEWDRKVG